MQDEQTRRSSGTIHGPAILALIVGVVSLLLGLGAGYVLTQQRVDVLEEERASLVSQLDEHKTRLDQVKEDLQRKETRVEELAGEQGRLREQLSTAEGRVESLGRKVDEQAEKIAERQESGREPASTGEEFQDLNGLVERLEADRKILIELRKDPLTEQEEAMAYWRRLKDLSARSDSALAQKADRVLQVAPSFFEWQETQFESAQEEQTMYFLLGADQYPERTTEFFNAALLVVINRLDTIAEITRSSTS